jgi:uncharacterized protein
MTVPQGLRTMAVAPEPSNLTHLTPLEMRRSGVASGDALPPPPLEGHGLRFYQSPARFVALLWAAFTNLPQQFEILRLFRRPAFTNVLRANRLLPLKYLTRDYLVRGLPVPDRAACLAHHYQRMTEAFPPDILQRILDNHVTLLEKKENDHHASVRLALARTAVREGELALTLEVDGTTVYVLQFTIVPGYIANSQAAEVLLVSRLQGIKGCYPQVSFATKVFCEVAPPALLLAALHGIADACSITEMAGISGESQFSYTADAVDSFRAAYDNVWLELGATKITANFFACSIPPPEKSLDGIKNGHKSRTRKKREFKRRIAQEACLLLQGWLPQPADETQSLEAAFGDATGERPIKRITLRPVPPKSSQPS